MVSQEALIVLQRATKRTHPRKLTSISEITTWYLRKNIKIPLLFQCGLFINTQVSKNSIVFVDVTFYLRWYNVIRWSSHICKKSSFLSFYSFFVKFSEWHRGNGRVNLTKCDKVEWGEKCNRHSFWIVPGLIFYKFVIIFLKLTDDEKLKNTP